METSRNQGSEGAPVEVPTVSKDLYRQAHDALVKEGFTFLVTIQPVSIGQLLGDKATKNLFGYVDPSKQMRIDTPPQIEVAIDLGSFRIEGSNNNSTAVQKSMIKDQEAALKSKLPEGVRDVISMVMPKHPSVLAQLDLENKRRGREVLFTNWFGSAAGDQMYSDVSIVGRDNPTRSLRVESRFSARGYSNVFAVAVAILPRLSP